MKRCHYCAGEIQDAAIKCKHCGSMLGGSPMDGGTPTGVPAPASPPPLPILTPRDEALQYSHSGSRFLLGFGSDFYGIWDRQAPEGPVRRFPRSDDGWREAWLLYADWEPDRIEVGLGGSPAVTATTTAATTTGSPSGSKPVGWAWWLLPVFFGWIGGLIAWGVTRDRDARNARMMLIAGIAISVVNLLILLASGELSRFT